MNRTKFLFILSLTFLFFINPLSAQDRPQPPPVSIEFELLNTPHTGEDAEILLRVTPEEDMHLDIGVLIPLKVAVEKGEFIITPYKEPDPAKMPERNLFRKRIVFYAGEITALQTKEFTFKIKISDNLKHILLAHIVAQQKWGEAEKSLEINL